MSSCPGAINKYNNEKQEPDSKDTRPHIFWLITKVNINREQNRFFPPEDSTWTWQRAIPLTRIQKEREYSPFEIMRFKTGRKQKYDLKYGSRSMM